MKSVGSEEPVGEINQVFKLISVHLKSCLTAPVDVRDEMKSTSLSRE